MANSDDPSYPVGYKKPPRHTQFKRGQSGNPSGRPRKTTSIDEAFQKELHAKVVVVPDGGKRQKISKLNAIFRQLINSAARGDTKAAALVFKRADRLGSEQRNNLRELIETMRAKHEQLEADRDRIKPGNKRTSNRLRKGAGPSMPEAGFCWFRCFFCCQRIFINAATGTVSHSEKGNPLSSTYVTKGPSILITCPSCGFLVKTKPPANNGDKKVTCAKCTELILAKHEQPRAAISHEGDGSNKLIAQS